MLDWFKNVKKTWSHEKGGTNEPPETIPSHPSVGNRRPILRNVNDTTLEEIRETLYTLVKISNGEQINLTQRQAYLAVRVMDLTEGFIGRVDFSDSKWSKYRNNYGFGDGFVVKHPIGFKPTEPRPEPPKGQH